MWNVSNRNASFFLEKGKQKVKGYFRYESFKRSPIWNDSKANLPNDTKENTTLCLLCILLTRAYHDFSNTPR